MTTAEAARLLRDGGLVALPTETVYGLAADAGNEEAVKAVFAMKGRPSTNPLIVHVADAGAARRVAGAWPEAAERLAEAFWPGPLTIVVPLDAGPEGPARGGGARTADSRAFRPGVKGRVASLVTAGGDTVGLRVPDHPLTLDVLRRFHELGGIGLAMPSANVSEHVSPTTAEHVGREFGDGVAVLDGGPCRVGIESTVVSLVGDVPTVLRPGHITIEQLRGVLGDLRVRGGSDDGIAASPGRQPRHYAPSVPCFSFDGKVPPVGEGTILLLRRIAASDPTHIAMPDEPAAYAAALYDALRDAERRPGVVRIGIELPPDEPAWAAVRDRIARASVKLKPRR